MSTVAASEREIRGPYNWLNVLRVSSLPGTHVVSLWALFEVCWYFCWIAKQCAWAEYHSLRSVHRSHLRSKKERRMSWRFVQVEHVLLWDDNARFRDLVTHSRLQMCEKNALIWVFGFRRRMNDVVGRGKRRCKVVRWLVQTNNGYFHVRCHFCRAIQRDVLRNDDFQIQKGLRRDGRTRWRTPFSLLARG